MHVSKPIVCNILGLNKTSPFSDAPEDANDVVVGDASPPEIRFLYLPLDAGVEVDAADGDCEEVVADDSVEAVVGDPVRDLCAEQVCIQFG